MLWANFLHVYQPHGQDPDVLEAIIKQCYEPVFNGILQHEDARITININAALLELFDKYGYHELIETIAEGGRQGKIEFTGSAKYHALLPFLPREEMLRQISINHETNRHYLGDVYQPRGIFLPEMAYSPKVAPAIEEAGFEWVLLDEIAYGRKIDSPDNTKLYKIKDTDVRVFFRERRISNLIMSAVVRSADSLKEAIQDDLVSSRYAVTGMDGETFGHHRIGLENLLFEIFKDPDFNLVRVSDIMDRYEETEEVEPVASTWASSQEDIENDVQFISWADPDNEIHELQWRLWHIVVDEFYRLPEDDPMYDELRHKLDYAVASDQFFWASAKPWWSIDMIEEGSYSLFQIIQKQPNADEAKRQKAYELYNQILSAAFEWKRSGKISQLRRERREKQNIPFKERTLEAGGAEEGVYHAFVDMMKERESIAASQQDYEEAILWRDAIYKLEHKLDVYEALHAVDLLRTRITNEEVEETIEKYKDQYSKIRGGQPEQRD